MAIKNISEMSQALKTYDANNWSKKVDLENVSSFDLEKTSDITGDKKSSTFADFLTSSLAEVNKLQQDANVAMEKLASGKSDNLHETMLAVEKADIAFKTMNQVRNKVISAYQEIMKMQV